MQQEKQFDPIEFDVEQTEYGLRVRIPSFIEKSEHYVHRVNTDPPGQMRVTFCYDESRHFSVADVITAHLRGTTLGFDEEIFTKSGKVWVAGGHNARPPIRTSIMHEALERLLTTSQKQKSLYK